MGRGPVVHDLTAGFTVFGFLDTAPSEALVELRERIFAQIHTSHHYRERRAVVDMVPVDVLGQSHDAIAKSYEADWQSNLNL